MSGVHVDAASVAESFLAAGSLRTKPRGRKSRELISLPHGLKGPGTSVKAQNLLLDLPDLVRSLATAAVGFAGATALPWTAPLVGLLTYLDLRGDLRVEITEEMAVVVWVLFDDGGALDRASIREAVNSVRRQHHRDTLPADSIDALLLDLEHIQAVERAVEDDQVRWRLVEEVVIGAKGSGSQEAEQEG